MNDRLKLIDELAATKLQQRRELPPDGVMLTRGDTLNPEPVQWLWPGWLAQGKLAILAGAPGTGKTTIALNLASTVTVGGHWPDGTFCAPGDVLIWSGEDDPSDTLLPRLVAAGADRERLYFVGDVREVGELRPFDPAYDTTALLLAAAGIPDLKFILIDPVSSAVAGDSHKNGEVRRALQPLVDFASQAGAALVGITHFSKGGQGQDPSQRVIGSVAFSAVARVVLVAAKTKDLEGNERRIFARSKSNLGPDDGGYTYTLEQTEPLPGIHASVVRWGVSLEGNARDLLAEPDEEKSASKLAEAIDWLRNALANGLTPVTTLEAESSRDGLAWKTVQRAAHQLSVMKRKGGVQDGWYWKLKDSEIKH